MIDETDKQCVVEQMQNTNKDDNSVLEKTTWWDFEKKNSAIKIVS